MKGSNGEKYDWLGIVLSTSVMYLLALWPFILDDTGIASIFALSCVLVMAYERGYKLVWKKDGDKKLAIFIFFIPCAIGLFSISYVLIQLLSL